MYAMEQCPSLIASCILAACTWNRYKARDESSDILYAFPDFQVLYGILILLQPSQDSSPLQFLERNGFKVSYLNTLYFIQTTNRVQSKMSAYWKHISSLFLFYFNFQPLRHFIRLFTKSKLITLDLWIKFKVNSLENTHKLLQNIKVKSWRYYFPSGMPFHSVTGHQTISHKWLYEMVHYVFVDVFGAWENYLTTNMQQCY